jgi:hypothetical protein
VKAAHDGKQETTRTCFVVHADHHHGVVGTTNCKRVHPGTFSTLVDRALTDR